VRIKGQINRITVDFTMPNAPNTGALQFKALLLTLQFDSLPAKL